MTSSQDALSLLNKWNQESSKVRCTIVGAGLRSSVTGTVAKVNPAEAFGIQTSDGNAWVMVFFNRVSFLDHDESASPTPANPDLNDLPKDRYAGFLSMKTDSATFIVIGKLQEVFQ